MSSSYYSLNNKYNILLHEISEIAPPIGGYIPIQSTIPINQTVNGDLNLTATNFNVNNPIRINNTSDIKFGNPTINTLTSNSWSGNIESVNTSANLTHYLGFFDSSGTGIGKPQKNASLSCNPSNGGLNCTTLNATTINGTVSTATTTVGINLTSDDTFGSYFIPFSKTDTATNNSLFLDNTTSPLTYNPNTSTLTSAFFQGTSNLAAITDTNDGATYYPIFVSNFGNGQTIRCDKITGPFSYTPSTGILTASVFNGSASTAAITDTNDAATYYPVFVSASGSGQTLRADLTTGPFSYIPSNGNMSIGGAFSAARYDGDVRLPAATAAITSFTTGVLSLAMGTVSFRNFGWIVTGATNTMSGITLSTTVINGNYNVCVINNGSGNLTLNTGLTGGTYYLKYTAPVVVPAGSLAVIEIKLLSVNAITRVIVNAYNVT